MKLINPRAINPNPIILIGSIRKKIIAPKIRNTAVTPWGCPSHSANVGLKVALRNVSSNSEITILITKTCEIADKPKIPSKPDTSGIDSGARRWNPWINKPPTNAKPNAFNELLYTYYHPSLTLEQLVAITPDQYDVNVVDGRYQKIDFEWDGNIVGISCRTAVAKSAYNIADEFQKRGKTVSKNFTQHHAVYISNGLTKEQISEVFKEAYTRFYSRPNYLFNRLMSIQSLTDVERNIRGGLAFLNKKTKIFPSSPCLHWTYK